jgi:hypothetical protein
VLGHTDLLSMPVRSSAAALGEFARRLERFRASYADAIDGVRALGRRTVVCTIYNGALAQDEAAIARVALATFNDVILQTAFERRLDVIELRAICNEPADYANPIEPSGSGGLKIAQAIARAVGATAGEASRVWA